MTGRRAFTMLPTYSGKPEEFDLWRFQILQFLSSEPAFPAFIDWIETRLSVKESEHRAERDNQEKERKDSLDYDIDPEGSEEREKLKPPNLEWLNEQLYQVLALNTKGEALNLIKSLASYEHAYTRGITAWQRLTKDHRGNNAQRILGLVGRGFQPV